MASFESLEGRNLAAAGIVGSVVSDSPVAVRIRYLGAGTVTSVTVTTAVGVVFIANGVTQTYPFAAGLNLNTIGKFVDAVNVGGCTEAVATPALGVQLWEAKVLDTLRSYTTTSKVFSEAIAATSLDGIAIWDMKVDTALSKCFSYRLTASRSFVALPKGSRRVHLKEVVYNATLGGAAVDNFQIWSVNGSEETKLFSALSVSGAATTINWAAGYGHITSEDGSDIVVVLKDAVTLTDATANFMTVSGLIEK